MNNILSEYKVKEMSFDSSLFPNAFKRLQDCPKSISVIGDETLLNEDCISIVGTRFCSQEASTITQNISKGLAENGYIIVSGLASGIDQTAHTATFNVGKTIAIIPSSFNSYLTGRKLSIAKKILENGGAIVCEDNSIKHPEKFCFLKRNRLISMLSKSTIVVQAPYKSGAINTATNAINQNVPLWAVPWNVFDSASQGSNNLFLLGAKPLIHYSQIIAFLENSKQITLNNLISDAPTSISSNEITNSFIKLNSKKDVSWCKLANILDPIPDEFKEIYNFVKNNSPANFEKIANNFYSLSTSELTSKLMLMEINGFIKEINNEYILSNY